MSRDATEQVRQRLPDAVVSSHDSHGDDTVVVRAEKAGAVIDLLKNELGFDMMVDLCGNDYPGRPERFEVVYHLQSTASWKRVRVRVPLGASDPRVESMCGRFRMANWFEREAYDMYGIRFDGHPSLRRILTHESFQGHPLRKDYDKRRRQDVEAPAPIERAGIADEEGPEHTRRIAINFGPAHPITHGVLRVQMLLDGETVVRADTEIGYLHRCFEKESETTTWAGVMPYTDRLNYCSSLLNTVGYAMAVEKLAGIEVTERCAIIRVIISEVSRIMDHVVCLGPNLVDLGAMTTFWYTYAVREHCYRIVDKLSGSRLTNTYVRIGGLAADAYDGFEEDLLALRAPVEQALRDIEKLVAKNRIFLDRTVGIGVVSRQDAIDYGLTGPMARASGLEYDVRKAHPYYHYDDLDWEMVVGSAGDTHHRIWVRVEEIRQSLRIIEQAVAALPDGPVNVERPDVILPPKEAVYTNIEALVAHFDQVMLGARMPAGEAYGYCEGGNGELGFYVVSDGGGHPQRVRCRPPCFANLQIFDHVIEGLMLADVAAVLGSLNIIAGELDR